MVNPFAVNNNTGVGHAIAIGLHYSKIQIVKIILIRIRQYLLLITTSTVVLHVTSQLENASLFQKISKNVICSIDTAFTGNSVTII